ncbi:MAG TPA: hypothetical protein VNT50_09230 [Microbacterium sp.]|uniref:hypothetical protein n=1 Tax=Microbacterium sp. TaxID=51671 RepID=UPI002C4EF6C2|nr:hypothetical protein [Microbacterium sp.]HWI31665.1 hypothetical protein [Microbacterium sp.]
MPARERVGIAGTDRVLLPVRWLAVVLLPFLLIAAGILILLPARVADLFAWPIEPPITGMILGAAYLGGIVYFAGVLFTAEWHRVRRGLLPVFVFSSLLGIATALHADRFTPNLSFVVWSVLYATTPFLIAAAAVAQRSADPGTPASRETIIPAPVAWTLVVVGGIATLTGLTMFVSPAAFIGVWGWDLTPLTARTLGAILSLTGFVNASMIIDRRWTSFRILYAAQLVSIAFVLTAIWVGRADVQWERPAAWGFVALLVMALGCYGGLAVWAERRMRRAARAGERAVDRQA